MAFDVRNNFHIVDYAVFALFLLCSALIGVIFGWRSRKSTDNKEFLTGNRNLPMFPVVMSLAASFMSTNTMLGVPAEIYLLGTQFIINLVPIIFSIILSANVFMPVFYRLNMTSVNEYLKLRFKSQAARLVGSWAFLLCTVPYMAVVLYGPSLALSSVTPLSLEKSILAVGIICTFYTSFGGIRAVIWTDVMQCILMILGLAMVCVKGSIDAGGFLEPFRIADEQQRLKLFDFTLSLYRNDTLIAVFSGTLMGWCGMYCVSQTEVQRFCSTKSQSHAKKTLYWNIPVVTGIAALGVWCGIVLTAKYVNCDPVMMGIIKRHDQMMPYYVMETMSMVPGIPGLFTACIFSAALSTLSSGFNSLAAVTWDDMLKHHFTHISPRTSSYLTKGIAASYGILSIGLSFVVGRLGTVLQASIAISGSIRGPLLALFVLAFFFPSCNSKGGVFGTILGVSCSLFIALMTIVYPRQQTSLPASTDGCSNETYLAYGDHNRTILQLPWDYHPEGIRSIIHISYFYISGLGFFVTIITGLLIAFVTGGRKEPVDGRYMSEYRLRGSNVFMSKLERDEDGNVDQPLMQKTVDGVTLESLERPRRSEQIQVPLRETTNGNI